MTKQHEIYNQLSQTLSDEEIVVGYFLPEVLSPTEQALAEEELLALRVSALRAMSPEQKMLSELFRMKLLLQDYLQRPSFEAQFAFSAQLEAYIKVLGRSQKTFAKEIDLHPTRLSRLLNGREMPNVELTYRLEVHCGHIIPAVYWWKLLAKQLEEEVRTNQALKQIEAQKVTNYLKFSA
jgi:plasmid maintenance system antidote protein VapI